MTTRKDDILYNQPHITSAVISITSILDCWNRHQEQVSQNIQYMYLNRAGNRKRLHDVIDVGDVVTWRHHCLTISLIHTRFSQHWVMHSLNHDMLRSSSYYITSSDAWLTKMSISFFWALGPHPNPPYISTFLDSTLSSCRGCLLDNGKSTCHPGVWGLFLSHCPGLLGSGLGHWALGRVHSGERGNQGPGYCQIW